MSEQKDIWVKKAEKWLWDSCGYAPDTSVEEIAAWMEKAEAWDSYLEAIKNTVPHVSLADYEGLEDKLDASKKEGLEHHAIAVEYYEKLEAIKTHFKFFPVSIKNISQWIKQGRKILEGGT